MKKAIAVLAAIITLAAAPIGASADANPWTDAELAAIARTLSGECYDDKAEDKRLVCEVILNRASAGGFGDGVIGVVTKKKQFAGYWDPSREVSEDDLAVAKKALEEWHEGGCAALSEWLFFSRGANRENEFRKVF
jgi:spore germination cell wall hydrolase CwlJ-like protein